MSVLGKSKKVEVLPICTPRTTSPPDRTPARAAAARGDDGPSARGERAETPAPARRRRDSSSPGARRSPPVVALADRVGTQPVRDVESRLVVSRPRSFSPSSSRSTGVRRGVAPRARVSSAARGGRHRGDGRDGGGDDGDDDDASGSGGRQSARGVERRPFVVAAAAARAGAPAAGSRDAAAGQDAEAEAGSEAEAEAEAEAGAET